MWPLALPRNQLTSALFFAPNSSFITPSYQFCPRRSFRFCSSSSTASVYWMSFW